MYEKISTNKRDYEVNNSEDDINIELDEFSGTITELLEIVNVVKDKYNVPLDKITLQGYHGCYFCGGQMSLSIEKEKEEPKQLSIEEMKKLGEEFNQLCGERNLKQNRLEEISEIFKQQKMGK